MGLWSIDCLSMSPSNRTGPGGSFHWNLGLISRDYGSLFDQITVSIMWSKCVHSSHIHAGSVCVCGWFNVIHRRKHCIHPAGVAGSNPPTPPFSTAFRAFLLAYSTPISLCLNIVRKWRLNHRIHQIPRWPLSGRWELPLMFSSPKFSNPKIHES